MGRTAVPMWRRLELPTWILTLAIYGSWLTLTFHFGAAPLWLMAPLGAFLLAWHGSLQHEVIHGHPTSSRVINDAIGSLPLGLLLPYGIYRDSHIEHHKSPELANPLVDPESFFVIEERWATLSAPVRFLHWCNATLLGRLLLGPAFMFVMLAQEQWGRLRRGDFSHVKHWLSHALFAAPVLYWLTEVCGISLPLYLVAVVYPGFSLTLLRSFAEHAPADDNARRTAVVECCTFFGVLFLFNNLHVVHHDDPRLPWYDYRAAYRAERESILAKNGGYTYSGYFELLRRFAVAPRRSPVYVRRS